MAPGTKLDASVLRFDEDAEATRICDWLIEALATGLRRRGLVLGISGGVDSSVCAALAVRALGPGKVYGLLMPEVDSSSTSETNGTLVAEALGIAYETFDIAPALRGIGCYAQRDEAIRSLFPAYDTTWKSKIVIAGGASGGMNFFKLVVEDGAGVQVQKRLPLKQYLEIVAATNHKQRIRKSVEYYHADRLNYAVIGTPNRLEYDQGFFVKNGDGSADIKPIAHLYKTQVYAMARHLGLPDVVCNALPTTDTYSLAQGQDEFYFVLPYHQMDLALWAHNHRLPATDLAAALGISAERAQFIYGDIEAKRRATAYLHAAPLLLEPVFG